MHKDASPPAFEPVTVSSLSLTQLQLDEDDDLLMADWDSSICIEFLPIGWDVLDLSPLNPD